nr:MAG TPA: hypothetical protein [Caudoviricetes sp.]
MCEICTPSLHRRPPKKFSAGIFLKNTLSLYVIF